MANVAGSKVISEQGFFPDTEINYKLFQVTKVASPAALAANLTRADALTGVTGVLAGDECIAISKPTHQVGLYVLPGLVTADESMSMIIVNCSVGELTATPSQTYTFTMKRKI